MTFRDALIAQNLAFTVGSQTIETLAACDETRNGKRSGLRRAHAQAVEMMTEVVVPDAAIRAGDDTHQFSGGIRQRIMIAIALTCRPRLLMANADEPTTALDVTIQVQDLDVVAEIRAKLGVSVVVLSHGLGIVAEHCHQVVAMYGGQIDERGPTRDVFAAPLHAWIIALRSAPGRPNQPHPAHRGVCPRGHRIARGMPVSAPLPGGERRMQGTGRQAAMQAAAPGRKAPCIDVRGMP